MLIRLDDHMLVMDLCAHYRRAGFQAESMGGGMIEVSHEKARSPEQERWDVLTHLRLWRWRTPTHVASCSDLTGGLGALGLREVGRQETLLRRRRG